MTAPTVQVVGQWLQGGRPLRGSVEFVPSASVVDTTTGAKLVRSRVVARVDPFGRINVQLTATTGSGTSPAGWVWRVSEHVVGQEQPATYDLALPAGSGPVDLASVAPVASFSPVIYGPVLGTVYDGGTP